MSHGYIGRRHGHEGTMDVAIEGFPYSFLILPVSILGMRMIQGRCIVEIGPVGTNIDGANSLYFPLTDPVMPHLQKFKVSQYRRIFSDNFNKISGRTLDPGQIGGL